MAEEVLFKPRELYDLQLKKLFHDSSSDYFDKLVEESKIDVEANKKHVADLNKKKIHENSCKKRMDSVRGGKNALLVFSIIFAVIGTILIVYGATNGRNVGLLCGIGAGLLSLGIAGIVIVCAVLRKKVISAETTYSEAKKASEASYAKCVEDMINLNALYDWNMPSLIMKKATPIIQIDQYFNNDRVRYLVGKFGMSLPNDPHQSVLEVLSGSIQGNPFVEQKFLKEELRPKTYTGSITITWTTTYRDSKGNTHTQMHSQVLTASVTEPAPHYEEITYLAYGNEAAPHLTFSRKPFEGGGAHVYGEKDREKIVKKEMKKLIKKSEKAIASGDSFTVMGNDDFDVFFGAKDRDNEVEFRLLFTPLAQANELDLITNPSPFGDDFSFLKKNMMNYVCSSHSQHFNYLESPEYFHSYSVELAKNKFIDYCDKFMNNLYFDLAPLLSIPLYQMHKPHEEIFKDVSLPNLNQFEHEVLANAMGREPFEPENASHNLPLIIKEKSAYEYGKVDNVNFHTYSYEEVPQLTLIPKLGGDGRWHDVPVHWIRYDLVEKDTLASFADIGLSGPEFNAKRANDGLKLPWERVHFERGLLAIYDNDTEVEDDDINIFSLKEK